MIMPRRTLLIAYRVAAALMVLIAAGYQLNVGLDRPSFTVGNFLSFFTIQSNLFAAGVLLWLAFRGARGHGDGQGRVDLIRGAATLYMATTGVVYGLLLSGYQEALQTTVPWVDTALHRVMPVVMVIDWLADPPETRLTVRRALPWLAYPALYLVYSLIRGPIVDWYPYPFIDPRNTGGYAAVAAYAVGITLGVLAFTWVIVRLGDWRRREDARAALAAPS